MTLLGVLHLHCLLHHLKTMSWSITPVIKESKLACRQKTSLLSHGVTYSWKCLLISL